MAVTPLRGVNGSSNFYVVRHADFRSKAVTKYRLQISTSAGNLTVPQLGGQLSLNGRDSKIHVTDLVVGHTKLLYSTAEVYSIANTESGPVLLLYAGPNELHEFAVPRRLGTPTIYGAGITSRTRNSNLVVQWTSSPERRILRFGSELTIYLLDRNEAYDIWPLEVTAPDPIGNYYSPSKNLVIVKAGYLLRTASFDGSTLQLRGDINSTTSIELVASPVIVDTIFFNGREVTLEETDYGTLRGTIGYFAPNITIPSLETLDWKYIDSLPELQATYDDSDWTDASLTTSNNSRKITTPVDLYAGDYGYHTGSLLYRGHFVANGRWSNFTIQTQGGNAFGHSIWLNSTFLGSWIGSPSQDNRVHSVKLPMLAPGQPYVFTVLIDHMGNDENGAAGYDYTKRPRGILDYSLAGYNASEITWKLTGNVGGEQYLDKTRGPLNEGALYAERYGYHQPSAPTTDWQQLSPIQGINTTGVGFFASEFTLNIPTGWDVPLSFVFQNGSRPASNYTGSNYTAPYPFRNATAQSAKNYRAVLYVNGYQFGKFVSNLGPQTEFPVPEGILNHRGKNTVAVALWALDAGGAWLDGFDLVPKAVVRSSLQHPDLAPAPEWAPRFGAY